VIGVIDYGAGNLGSVMNALQRLGCEARFVKDPEEIAGAKAPYEKLLFPGDGHFATAMASLEKSGYAAALRDWIQADKPFLGICIGLQLLLDSSEEAFTENGTLPFAGKSIRGLSVIPGTVKRFPGRKVPQIGWNQTQAASGSKLFRGLPENSFFY
jgi:imidazole glycerol phosphate synthase glutamine amidotransferase subunit